MSMSYTLPERNAIIEELDDLARKLGYASPSKRLGHALPLTIGVSTDKLNRLLVEYRDMVSKQQCGNCAGCTC